MTTVPFGQTHAQSMQMSAFQQYGQQQSLHPQYQQQYPSNNVPPQQQQPFQQYVQQYVQQQPTAAPPYPFQQSFAPTAPQQPYHPPAPSTQHPAGASARSGPNGGSTSVPNVPAYAYNGAGHQSCGRTSAPTLPSYGQGGPTANTGTQPPPPPPPSYAWAGAAGQEAASKDPATEEEFRADTSNPEDTMEAARALNSLGASSG